MTASIPRPFGPWFPKRLYEYWDFLESAVEQKAKLLASFPETRWPDECRRWRPAMAVTGGQMKVPAFIEHTV